MSNVKRALPVVREDRAGSLLKDGSRVSIIPADVHGRWATIRNVMFAGLIVVYLALPFIRIDGEPALFLDVVHRRFYLFGGRFNAQDAWLLFFVLTAVGLSLFVMAAIVGRSWCGFACPQTVFLDGVYRRIERWILGSVSERRKRAASPKTVSGRARVLVLHAFYLLVSSIIAHAFLSYFVSLPSLASMVTASPARHLGAFALATAMTLVLYGNFAWFREQTCLIVCPYGRLQGSLADRDTLIVTYDSARGEPRGKVSEPDRGACVDCFRCVDVCPTAIDIRKGAQLDCIGCTACIDACDEIMQKLARPKGLIRYESERGLTAGSRKFLRPRLLLYAGILLAWSGGAAFAASRRKNFEASLLRLRGAPYTIEAIPGGDRVQNIFELHLISKYHRPETFTIEPVAASTLAYSIAMPRVTLATFGAQRVPVFVQTTLADGAPGLARGTRVDLRIVPAHHPSDARTVTATFLGPGQP